jgi:hypothetical protein
LFKGPPPFFHIPGNFRTVPRLAPRFTSRLAPRFTPRLAPRFTPRLTPRFAPRFAFHDGRMQ